MPLNLTLTELGVGAVLLLPARCFSRWLSAGGKALAYRRPPSSLELKKKKKKPATGYLTRPGTLRCSPVRPPRPAWRPQSAWGFSGGARCRCEELGSVSRGFLGGLRVRHLTQGEKRSGSPCTVHFPELWDLHPGLGSDTCSLLRGSGV